MTIRWSHVLATVLAAVLTAGSAAADDDDDFEKRYRERQKKYEEQRREAVKKYEEQRRDALKREGEWQRKWEKQYREDFERQDGWRKKADNEGRKQFEEQLKRQMRAGDRRPDFGTGAAYPPPPPPFGAVPDETRLPLARRAAAQFGPELARALSGVGAGGRGFDPRAAQVAADLARRSERLAELARRDGDLNALRGEYAGLDAGWRQFTPYLDRAARDPGTRELAWRLYQSVSQLRSAVGYDARSAGPDWASAHAVARDQTVRLGQLTAAARADPRLDVNVAYDLRNAQREAQAFEELVARRARLEELREQHDYFAAAVARVTAQLQAAQWDAAHMAVVQQVLVADRQLCAAFGLPVYQDDAARGVVERAGELKVAADRLRRDMWAVLGTSDQEVIAYYVQPTDQLAASADAVYQMLTEGRPAELVQAGWQQVLDWTRVVGDRVRVLDQGQFPTVHQFAADTGRLVQEVHTFFDPAAPRP